eukprot:gnl/MRDRNA2_/MRDRNA2_34994_c0_seq1.p1 gnl/MRDRNA2_/MRDRNA2_34994_c0~~gnl/MRDRNA2_/MRDRNA2_34994_c0_seq1.p1  ORF type:complete len:202 (-),score=41.22 gnl/MRDRNA2_/MRDRNA2_34994_c0_seq1:173-778(-)
MSRELHWHRIHACAACTGIVSIGIVVTLYVSGPDVLAPSFDPAAHSRSNSDLHLISTGLQRPGIRPWFWQGHSNARLSSNDQYALEKSRYRPPRSTWWNAQQHFASRIPASKEARDEAFRAQQEILARRKNKESYKDYFTKVKSNRNRVQKELTDKRSKYEEGKDGRWYEKVDSYVAEDSGDAWGRFAAIFGMSKKNDKLK